jgi:hypothetical protein
MLKKIKTIIKNDDHVPIFREFGSELVKSGRLNSFEVIHVKI